MFDSFVWAFNHWLANHSLPLERIDVIVEQFYDIKYSFDLAAIEVLSKIVNQIKHVLGEKQA
jgi:hypothetical protein